MKKLIVLEWKKTRIRRYALGALVITVLAALFLFAQCYLGIANDPVTGVPDAAPGTFNITSQVELVTNVCFMVFTCVMLAGCVTGAYRSKHRALLFTYPVRRKTLLAAQMLAVWLFAFFSMALAKLAVYGLLFAAGQVLTPDFPLDYSMAAPGIYGQILLKSAVTVSAAFIALPVGRLFRSRRATILASFFLLLVMNGTVGPFSLADNAAVPLLLAAAGLGCGALSVAGIEEQDIL